MEILKYIDNIQKILENTPYVALIVILLVIIYFQHKARVEDSKFMKKMTEKSVTIDDKSKDNYFMALAEVQSGLTEIRNMQKEIMNKFDILLFKK